MSEKPSDPKSPELAMEGAKPPSQPPVSPRTGRVLDDIDKLQDIPDAVNSDIYKRLEALQEAFFPIDQLKRFQPLDTKGWSEDHLLTKIGDNPFHVKLISELLRRIRKGLISPETATKYYTGSEKHKRNLVDNIVARMNAGVLTIETLPDGQLKSQVLEEFLEALYDTEFITPKEVREYNGNPELDAFIIQSIHDRDLPVAKPVAPGFQPPSPTAKPAIIARYHPIESRKETPPPVSAVTPESVPAPTIPATPGAIKVPSPGRKATLLAMSVPPPAAGSAPGAPVHVAPRPTSAPKPASVMPPAPSSSQVKAGPSAAFDRAFVLTEAAPPSIAAPTVRQGNGRTSPKDPRAALPTIADHEATRTALGRDQTHAAIEILPPPVAVGTMGSPDDVPPTSRPSSMDSSPDLLVFPKNTGSHLPPPVPLFAAGGEKVDENLYQSAHCVTVINDQNDINSIINIPLLLEDGEFTIGTNPQNDIVLTNPPGSDTVAEFHGVLKIVGEKITIKGKGGPLRVAQRTDRKGLILHSYVQVEQDEPILVGRVINGKADKYLQINVKLDQAFENDEIKDQVSEHCKSLLRTAGQKIVESIEGSHVSKPEASTPQSGEVRSYMKKAHELFQGLLVRLPNQFKDSDYTTWKNIALSEAQILLSKRLAAHISFYGQELLETTKRAVSDAVTGGTEIAAIQLDTEPPKFFTDFFDFARTHGINLSKSDYTRDLDHAKSEARRYLAEKKQVEADIKEADKRRAELEDELKNRPYHDHEAALKQFRKQYAGVHYREQGEGSELLTLETKFAHVGPVIIVRNTSGEIIENGLIPLLIHHQTIGTHDINTIELPQDHDPKRGAKPFMASIEYDEKLGQYRMTWIDGEIRLSDNEGGSGMPRSPVFTIQNDKPVFVGKYLVKIEQNHAFTASSIRAEYANPYVEELTEIIFDDAITTLDQTANAYNELKTLAGTGHVDIVALKAHLVKKITDLWARLELWEPTLDIQQINDPDASPVTPGRSRKPVFADAQALGTLHLLLQDRGGFIPKIPNLTQEIVEEAAKKRFDAYVTFDRKSKEPGAKFPSIYGLFKKGKDRMAEHKKQKEDAKLRANVGVVETARFLDMGVFKQETINNQPNISEEYSDRINEIYRIRKLVDEIRNGGKDVENFALAMKLCGEKTMEEVFGPDEIAAFNVNIEVNITAKTPAIKYLRKLYVFLGRNHVRLLGNEDNQKSISALEKLLEIKAVTLDEIIVPPYFMGSEVKSAIEDAKMFAQMKKELEDENKALTTKKHETMHQQQMNVLRNRQALVDKFAKVVGVVGQAQQETRLDLLLEIADIIRDPKVEEEMDGDGISMEISLQPRDVPTLISGSKDAAVVVATEKKRLGWHAIKADFKVIAEKAARAAAEKIMTADPDSQYQFEVLAEAIQKGIVNPNDIGYTPEQLQKKLEQFNHEQKIKALRMKHTPFFEQNSNLRVDNLEYLDQIKLDTISDPDEAAVLLQLVEDLSYIRMEKILDNINKGIDASYMKMIGNELLEKGYRAQLHFPAEKLALLQ